jgi:hypothetical protein
VYGSKKRGPTSVKALACPAVVRPVRSTKLRMVRWCGGVASGEAPGALSGGVVESFTGGF